MNAQERQDQLDAYMKGTNELIVNVGVLTTGWDFPPVQEIFIVKPTKSLNKYTQMIGRGTRSLDGLLDISMNKEEVSSNSLFG